MSREARALVLLGLVLLAGALKEPRLLQSSSIHSILLWMPLLAVMAVGQMLVIVTRGIDVSIGSTLAFSGLAVGLLFRAHPGFSPVLAALIAVAIGLCLGLVNGILVAWVKIPPIIATLGTLTAYRGLTFILARGTQIYGNDVPAGLTDWAKAGPVPLVSWLFVLALVICAASFVFTSRTVLGRALYAIGSNAEASKLHGIPVDRLTVLAYAVCGSLAGLGGVMYLSRNGLLAPSTAGAGIELTVIAATVIGGTDVRGGAGTVPGVFIGCALLGTINVALSVVGIDVDWQLLVYGAVIVLALAFDAVLSRRRFE
jgi:rhamnose transport system permease protein